MYFILKKKKIIKKFKIKNEKFIYYFLPYLLLFLMLQ